MSQVRFTAVTPDGFISEGPHWDESTGTLLYVNVKPRGEIHRFNPATRETKLLKVVPGSTGETVSFVVPCAADPEILLIGLGRDIAAVRWSTNAPNESSLPTVSLTTVGLYGSRLNDAKCDPCGRLWAGTMGLESDSGQLEMEKGSLFRFNANLEAMLSVDKVSISNGLCWSLDKNNFFYIDTCKKTVDVFDYDNSSGVIFNRRVLFDYVKEKLEPDLPDGMTIDVNGNIWVANFFGQKLICIDSSTGRLQQTIATPCKNMTSCCWGGPDYSTMYVTSAKLALNDLEIKTTPTAGAVFEVTGLGTRGLPPVNVELSEEITVKIAAKLTT